VREKPKWFTKDFIASIPLSVLSKEIRDEIMIDDNGEKREDRLSDISSSGVMRRSHTAGRKASGC
jgi:hypothetical protein